MKPCGYNSLFLIKHHSSCSLFHCLLCYCRLALNHSMPIQRSNNGNPVWGFRAESTQNKSDPACITFKRAYVGTSYKHKPFCTVSIGMARPILVFLLYMKIKRWIWDERLGFQHLFPQNMARYIWTLICQVIKNTETCDWRVFLVAQMYSDCLNNL